MEVIYLGFNAVMYAVFAAWCAIAPKTTSAYVGLLPTGPGGESEYMAVYGGLQAGLAVFFGLAVFAPEHRRAAMLFSLALYGGLVAFRSIAVVRLGFGPLGHARVFYVMEILLFLGALLLTIRGGR